MTRTFPRQNRQDETVTAWDVSAGGYRLVVVDGAIRGLAYDEWPWPWGDPRYDDVTEDCDGWLADLVYDRTVKIMPAPSFSGPLRLRRTPGYALKPLPAGAPWAFMGLSDQLTWEKCDCPWWHRLPIVRWRVHADLP